ncbi:MAG: hypothetical protein AAFZ07_19595 [Actinomycetota bacterium]
MKTPTWRRLIVVTLLVSLLASAATAIGVQRLDDGPIIEVQPLAIIDSLTEPAATTTTTTSSSTTTTTTATQPGVLSWCDPATWVGGVVPGVEDRANVNGPVIVGLPWDHDDNELTPEVPCEPTVGAIRTTAPLGDLIWTGPSTEVTVDAAAGGDATGRVEVMGRLTMRPTGFDQQHVLSFAGLDADQMLGGDDGMMTDPGGLHAMGAGVLDLNGPDRTAWTRLSGAAARQDDAIDVDDPGGWQIGDLFVVTPTGPSGDDGYSYGTIIDITGGVITLQGLWDHDDDPSTPMVPRDGLEHDHPTVSLQDGELLTAEVLNLTRNVVIRTVSGDPSYVTMHPSSGVQHVTDVAFVGLGPDVVGRYPVHLHLMGEGSRGSTFDRLLILDSNNRAVVPHGSHGTTWTDVVAHRVTRDGFWWDRGQDENASNDTTYHRAVASDIRATENAPAARARLAGFELASGTGNTVTGSVAVGVEGIKDSSGFEWLEGAAGGGTGEWVFTGNVSHNNRRHGFFGWQNTNGTHVISDFVAASNGGWGVSHGAYRNKYLWERGQLIANGSGGVLIHANGREEGVRFVDIYVADSPTGFATTNHNREALAPTFIVDPTFSNVDVPLVAGGRNNPDVVRVSGWATCPEFADGAHPDNEWVLTDPVPELVCVP